VRNHTSKVFADTGLLAARTSGRRRPEAGRCCLLLARCRLVAGWLPAGCRLLRCRLPTAAERFSAVIVSDNNTPVNSTGGGPLPEHSQRGGDGFVHRATFAWSCQIYSGVTVRTRWLDSAAGAVILGPC
jgi:hypothetical protein